MIGVSFHIEAEAVSFYESLLPGLGKAFAAEVKKTVRLIQAHPDTGHGISPGLRRHLVRRFPFSLIYHHEARSALILAVAHQRRKLGYWRARKK